MTTTRLKTIHVLPMTDSLKRMQNRIYRQVLDFARHKSGKPDLENLDGHPELEGLCDAPLLIRAGAMMLEYTDYLPSLESEGIVLKLNLERD